MNLDTLKNSLPANFKKYLFNTLWLIVENGLVLLLSFVVGIMLINYMSKEEYGFYSYAASLVLIFSIFSNLGLASVLVKQIVNKTPLPSLLGTAFVIKLIGACFALVTLVVFLLIVKTPMEKMFLVLIFASSILFKIFDVISAYFDAEVKSKYSVIARVSAMLVNNILKLIIILLGLPTYLVYFTFVVDAILLMSLLIYFYQKQDLKIKEWHFEPKLFKNLLSTSWPLMLSIIATTIYLKIDQVMIVNIIGTEANADYAASEKITSIFYTFPFIIGSSLFPAIIKSRNISIPLFDKRYARLIQFMVFCALVLSISISFLSSDIIGFLFKGGYESSAAILRVHIWSTIIVFVNYSATRWFVAEGLESYAIINSSVGLVINVILNLFFLNKFGVIGAAYATLISQFISCYLVPLFFKPTRKLFYTQIVSTLKGPFLLFNVKAFVRDLKS